ncbi:uncharacterized protein EV420DRAFT_1641635 [Desarmillaria tabescens]|uniref:JmjC domain-containing protein n=1 Tax=Armillaria tabescens TaxID=1929756 RepID=A0AA39KHQ0_ARMTA|nr:uncharacterized protein EV420DRAFT_1641635 [Desarmillaria tabescens]KAK0460290.1 hypothetical protein EV420DRAFT_1641635 [Desarmillaria tabescens]
MPESIPRIHRILTYRVHKWGHENYLNFRERPELSPPWCDAPIMPLPTVQDIDPISVQDIIIGELPPVRKESSQNFFPLSRQQKILHERRLTQDIHSNWQKLMLMAPSIGMTTVIPSVAGRKRAQSEAFSNTGDTLLLKKTKLDRGLSRSGANIVSPILWDPKRKEYISCDFFPLLSNELDDRITIRGWNDCVVNDKTGSPRYKPDTGKGLEESMIVTLSFSNAMKNPTATLETFRNYHIFLYGTKTSPLTWSLNDLSKVGNVDIVREVQDHQRRSSDQTKDYLHVNLSLHEIYEEGLEDEGRVLNALSLPCSTSETGHPLQLIVSSHIRAFEQTSDLPEDIFDASYPISATNFWLVATKGVISYIHSDCHGVGTFVEVLCGQKLWYVFQHHGSRRQDSHIDEYMGDWAPGFIPDPREWEAEVVLLEPGSAFYMHPDTHHAVLTLENCIVRGGHFYSTVTLSKTISGWVHTCMLGYRIINVVHPELHQLLLRMMCYFHTVIGEKGPETQDTDIPSITRDGLLKLIALGNLCIFGSALLPCILPDSADATRPAITMAVGAYISIIRHLRVDFGLVFLAENNAVEPSIDSTILVDNKLSVYARFLDIGDFARSSMAHFGHSLIFYARKALRVRKAQGEHESLMFNFDSFRQDVANSLETFLQMELTTDFLHAPIFLVRKKVDLLDPGAYFDWNTATNFDCSDVEDDIDDSDGDDHELGKKEDGHGRDDSGSKDDDTEKKKDAPEELQESDVKSEPMSGEDESMHSEYMPSKSVL